MTDDFIEIDCDLYQLSFDKWLNSRILEGNYSKVARALYGDSHEDPVRAFRRRKNSGTIQGLHDLCGLANYLKINLSSMFHEIMGCLSYFGLSKKL